MTKWVSTKRIMRYGLVGFVRNGFVSLAAVAIMAITLIVLSTILTLGAAMRSTLTQLTNQVGINVYFTVQAQEPQILDVKKRLQSLPEVASVSYTSRDDALSQFRARHVNDQLTLQALDELGANPLGASLAVRARDTSQYESIAKFLDSEVAAEGDTPIIEKVNFYQNKTAIDRLTTIISMSRKIGIAIALIFGLASVLIAFNTIRLAIYTARDEIGVMRLVGASTWYVRGPFIIAGVFYGLVAAVIVLILLYPAMAYLGPSSRAFFGSFDTFSYYTGNFAYLFLVLIGSGVGLGAISSFFAVRRYLRD